MRVRRGLALVATWAAVSSTRGQGLVSITSHVFSDYNCTGLPTEYSWVAADTCLGFGSTTGSGYMYKCDANTSSLPTMHQCNVSYHSPTMNAHVLGRQELLDRELQPYRLLGGRAPAVMVSHAAYADISRSDRPASLCPEVVTGLLREELGFEGTDFVVLTDLDEVLAFDAVDFVR